MLTSPNRDEVELAHALIALLPEAMRAEPLNVLECDGGYGCAVIVLGDLAALEKKIPAKLVDRVRKTWPNEGQDLDDLLYERLDAVTPIGYVAA